MATNRRNAPPQNHAPEAPPQPERPSFLRILLLGLVGLMAIGLVLQAAGVPVATRSESERWVDPKSAKVQNRKMSDRKTRVEVPDDRATNAVLAEIADEFGGKVFTNLQDANDQKGWGLTDDEAHFYDNLRNRYASTNANWLNLVRRGKSIYATLNELTGRETNLQSLLSDTQKAARFYQQIQEIYQIPAEQSQQAAPRLRQTSDWASFIEAHQKS